MVEFSQVVQSPFRLGQTPEEQHLPDGHFRAVRRLMCNWTERWDLIGQIGSVEGSGYGELYPPRPGTGARAYAANSVGVGRCWVDADGFVAYPFALVTVFYSTRAPQYFGGKLVTEELKGYVQYHPQGKTGLRWGASDGPEVNVGVTKVQCGLIYSIDFYHVLGIPPGAFSLIGCCNDAPFNTFSFGYTFGAQTLLYRADAGRTIQLGGLNDFRLGYDFYFRPQTWNTEHRPGFGWQAVYLDTGERYYAAEPANFNYLVP